MSLSFKAFLYERSWQSNPVEIRRFNVDQDATTSYVYLLQKLTQVFPTVTTGNVSVAWTDSDGDLIVISSDEELVEALSHFDGVLFKLHLLKKNTTGTTATGEGVPAAGAQGKQSGPGNRRHWGVVCDGCSGPVIGVRYKCLVCDDYDLCSACEGRGVHVDHNMVTITEPRWGGRGRGCGPWGGHPGRRGCGPTGPWGRPTAGLGGCPLFWGGMPPSTASAGNCCGPTDKPSEPMDTDQPKVTEEQKEQIRNIGQFVSSFLQPFGIKVDVDTTAAETKDTEADEKPSSGESGATPGVSAEVIEDALSQLRAMGHTDDDGGWLTELVKAKGGNISKVIDALHFTEAD